MTAIKTQKSFLKRLWVYSLEMFPVLIYLPYILALYISLNFITQVISTRDITIDIYSIVGMISAFFVMLLMRTFDDLKDIDIDKDLFPDRAAPRGAVLKSDIQKVSIFSFTILLLTNILFAKMTLLVFVLVMLYLVLTFKWFFAEEIHRKNLYLTMATHQPIPYAINFYLIHTALASGNIYDSFTYKHAAILLFFSLPVTAWETSRKIRAIGKETEYETFSLLFGTRPATWIPFICLLLTTAIAVYIGIELNFSKVYFIIVSILGLIVIFYYIKFLIYPTVKNNILKNVAMIFTTVLFFTTLIFVIIDYKININL